MRKKRGVFLLALMLILVMCGTFVLAACKDDTTRIVTFDSVGGSVIAPITATVGGLITKPADPQLSGYNFKGWWRESTYETEWIFETDTVSDNMTLYAKWEKQSDRPNPPDPGPDDPDPDPDEEYFNYTHTDALKLTIAQMSFNDVLTADFAVALNVGDQVYDVTLKANVAKDKNTQLALSIANRASGVVQGLYIKDGGLFYDSGVAGVPALSFRDLNVNYLQSIVSNLPDKLKNLIDDLLAGAGPDLNLSADAIIDLVLGNLLYGGQADYTNAEGQVTFDIKMDINGFFEGFLPLIANMVVGLVGNNLPPNIDKDAINTLLNQIAEAVPQTNIVLHSTLARANGEFGGLKGLDATITDVSTGGVTQLKGQIGIDADPIEIIYPEAIETCVDFSLTNLSMQAGFELSTDKAIDLGALITAIVGQENLNLPAGAIMLNANLQYRADIAVDLDLNYEKSDQDRNYINIELFALNAVGETKIATVSYLNGSIYVQVAGVRYAAALDLKGMIDGIVSTVTDAIDGFLDTDFQESMSDAKVLSLSADENGAFLSPTALDLLATVFRIVGLQDFVQADGNKITLTVNNEFMSVLQQMIATLDVQLPEYLSDLVLEVNFAGNTLEEVSLSTAIGVPSADGLTDRIEAELRAYGIKPGYHPTFQLNGETVSIADYVSAVIGDPDTYSSDINSIFAGIANVGLNLDLRIETDQPIDLGKLINHFASTQLPEGMLTLQADLGYVASVRANLFAKGENGADANVIEAILSAYVSENETQELARLYYQAGAFYLTFGTISYRIEYDLAAALDQVVSSLEKAIVPQTAAGSALALASQANATDNLLSVTLDHETLKTLLAAFGAGDFALPDGTGLTLAVDFHSAGIDKIAFNASISGIDVALTAEDITIGAPDATLAGDVAEALKDFEEAAFSNVGLNLGLEITTAQPADLGKLINDFAKTSLPEGMIMLSANLAYRLNVRGNLFAKDAKGGDDNVIYASLGVVGSEAELVSLYYRKGAFYLQAGSLSYQFEYDLAAALDKVIAELEKLLGTSGGEASAAALAHNGASVTIVITNETLQSLLTALGVTTEITLPNGSAIVLSVNLTNDVVVTADVDVTIGGIDARLELSDLTIDKADESLKDEVDRAITDFVPSEFSNVSLNLSLNIATDGAVDLGALLGQILGVSFPAGAIVLDAELGYQADIRANLFAKDEKGKDANVISAVVYAIDGDGAKTQVVSVYYKDGAFWITAGSLSYRIEYDLAAALDKMIADLKKAIGTGGGEASAMALADNGAAVTIVINDDVLQALLQAFDAQIEISLPSGSEIVVKVNVTDDIVVTAHADVSIGGINANIDATDLTVGAYDGKLAQDVADQIKAIEENGYYQDVVELVGGLANFAINGSVSFSTDAPLDLGALLKKFNVDKIPEGLLVLQAEGLYSAQIAAELNLKSDVQIVDNKSVRDENGLIQGDKNVLSVTLYHGLEEKIATVYYRKGMLYLDVLGEVKVSFALDLPALLNPLGDKLNNEIGGAQQPALAAASYASERGSYLQVTLDNALLQAVSDIIVKFGGEALAFTLPDLLGKTTIRADFTASSVNQISLDTQLNLTDDGHGVALHATLSDLAFARPGGLGGIVDQAIGDPASWALDQLVKNIASDLSLTGDINLDIVDNAYDFSELVNGIMGMIPGANVKLPPIWLNSDDVTARYDFTLKTRLDWENAANSQLIFEIIAKNSDQPLIGLYAYDNKLFINLAKIGYGKFVVQNIEIVQVIQNLLLDALKKKDPAENVEETNGGASGVSTASVFSVTNASRPGEITLDGTTLKAYLTAGALQRLLASFKVNLDLNVALDVEFDLSDKTLWGTMSSDAMVLDLQKFKIGDNGDADLFDTTAVAGEDYMQYDASTAQNLLTSVIKQSKLDLDFNLTVSNPNTGGIKSGGKYTAIRVRVARGDEQLESAKGAISVVGQQILPAVGALNAKQGDIIIQIRSGWGASESTMLWVVVDLQNNVVNIRGDEGLISVKAVGGLVGTYKLGTNIEFAIDLGVDAEGRTLVQQLANTLFGKLYSAGNTSALNLADETTTDQAQEAAVIDLTQYLTQIVVDLSQNNLSAKVDFNASFINDTIRNLFESVFYNNGNGMTLDLGGGPITTSPFHYGNAVSGSLSASTFKDNLWSKFLDPLLGGFVGGAWGAAKNLTDAESQMKGLLDRFMPFPELGKLQAQIDFVDGGLQSVSLVGKGDNEYYPSMSDSDPYMIEIYGHNTMAVDNVNWGDLSQTVSFNPNLYDASQYAAALDGLFEKQAQWFPSWRKETDVFAWADADSGNAKAQIEYYDENGAKIDWATSFRDELGNLIAGTHNITARATFSVNSGRKPVNYSGDFSNVTFERKVAFTIYETDVDHMIASVTDSDGNTTFRVNAADMNGVLSDSHPYPYHTLAKVTYKSGRYEMIPVKWIIEQADREDLVIGGVYEGLTIVNEQLGFRAQANLEVTGVGAILFDGELTRTVDKYDSVAGTAFPDSAQALNADGTLSNVTLTWEQSETDKVDFNNTGDYRIWTTVNKGRLNEFRTQVTIRVETAVIDRIEQDTIAADAEKLAGMVYPVDGVTNTIGGESAQIDLSQLLGDKKTYIKANGDLVTLPVTYQPATVSIGAEQLAGQNVEVKVVSQAEGYYYREDTITVQLPSLAASLPAEANGYTMTQSEFVSEKDRYFINVVSVHFAGMPEDATLNVGVEWDITKVIADIAGTYQAYIVLAKGTAYEQRIAVDVTITAAQSEAGGAEESSAQAA